MVPLWNAAFNKSISSTGNPRWQPEKGKSLNVNYYPGNGKNTPGAVFAENRIVSNEMKQLFLTLLQTPSLSFATECIIISTSGFTWPLSSLILTST